MLCSKCTSLARQRFRNVEILRFENDMISRGILLLVNESRLNTRETFWNILQELFYRYQSEILTGWKSYKYKKLQGRGGIVSLTQSKELSEEHSASSTATTELSILELKFWNQNLEEFLRKSSFFWIFT